MLESNFPAKQNWLQEEEAKLIQKAFIRCITYCLLYMPSRKKKKKNLKLDGGAFRNGLGAFCPHAEFSEVTSSYYVQNAIVCVHNQLCISIF